MRMKLPLIFPILDLGNPTGVGLFRVTSNEPVEVIITAPVHISDKKL